MLRCLAADVYAERDLGSAKEAKLHATRFEEAVAAYLTQEGVAFETEEALVLRAAGATPDFRVNATVNGRHVGWIDAKTYYGAASMDDARLPVNKLRAQAERFAAVFGPGAFVFLCGCSSDMDFGADAIALDASPLAVEHLFAEWPAAAVAGQEGSAAALNAGEVNGAPAASAKLLRS